MQKQLIDPKKRYSKEELEDIFKSGEFSTAAMPKISSGTFENYQRQKQVGSSTPLPQVNPVQLPNRRALAGNNPNTQDLADRLR